MNLKIVATRSLSGAVYVALIVLSILQGGYVYRLLMLVLCVLLWKEYQQLCARITTVYRRGIGFYFNVLVAAALILAVTQEDIYTQIATNKNNIVIALGILAALCIYATIKAARFQPIIPKRALIVWIVGILWITLPICLLSALRYTSFTLWEMNVYAPLSLFLCIWLNDSGAYLIGSLIGKINLSPISPNKTWEGTLGGILLSTLVGGGWMAYAEWVTDAVHAFPLAGIISVAATMGDFLESVLKRQASVKDSGHIMPGHGGILDRLDSILIGVIFIFGYALIVD